MLLINMNPFNSPSLFKKKHGSRPNLFQIMATSAKATEYQPDGRGSSIFGDKTPEYKAVLSRDKDNEYKQCKTDGVVKSRSVYENSVDESKKQCKNKFYPPQPNGGKKHSKRNKSKKTRKNKSKKTRKKHRKFKKH